MEIIKTKIPEVVIIKPKVFEDSRGYFMESFNLSQLRNEIGEIDFIQDNEAKSSLGVLRGLHYQLAPYTQAKLVRVIKGSILDVAVDIRKGSPSFGQYVSVELSENNRKQLFVPRGFAHGYVVLSSNTIVTYKVDNIYSPAHESGIVYNCPTLNINWGIREDQIILSEKDSILPAIDCAMLL